MPMGTRRAASRGPGKHSHEEDDVFFVIEGTMSFFVGDAWIDASAGSLVIAPAGTLHDLKNRSSNRAGALNLSVPGDFQRKASPKAGRREATT